MASYAELKKRRREDYRYILNYRTRWLVFPPPHHIDITRLSPLPTSKWMAGFDSLRRKLKKRGGGLAGASTGRPPSISPPNLPSVHEGVSRPLLAAVGQGGGCVLLRAHHLPIIAFQSSPFPCAFLMSVLSFEQSITRFHRADNDMYQHMNNSVYNFLYDSPPSSYCVDAAS